MSDEPKFVPELMLRALDHFDVRYLVVGGLGTVLHGSRHVTQDLDIVADTDAANLQRLATALLALDARLRAYGLSDEESRLLPLVLNAETLANAATWTLMTDAGSLDVLTFLRSMSGAEIPFHALKDAAVVIQTDTGPVSVASLQHIIEAKTFAGRPKDLAVLPELHELLASKSRSGHAPRSLIEQQFTRALETASA